MTADHEARLQSLYESFNARNLERVLAAMAPDVDWPDGWEGGRVVGHDAVRDYWHRQWAEIQPFVRPTAFAQRADDRLEVAVHQVVRDAGGNVSGQYT